MDIQYLLLLQNLRALSGDVFDAFFIEITTYSEALIAFLLLGMVYWCIDKHTGSWMAFNVAVSCTWNQVVKNICRIDRPWVRDERVKPVEEAITAATGYSFPSGHTQRAVATWGTLGTALWKKHWKGLGVICWSVVLLIAFSRNCLGVHTPQDVLFAAGLGILILYLTSRVLKWADAQRNRDIIVAVAGCLLCIVPMLWLGCLTYAGSGVGFMIGWVLERHFVRFEVQTKSIACRCMRFAIGALGILLILTVCKAALTLVMSGAYAGFVTNLILSLFIIVVYPFLFQLAERRATKKTCKETNHL